jgi:uridine kinase
MISAMASFVIGVAGGSGSGKTTVVRRIVDSLGPEHVTLLDHDRYYPQYDFTRHARLSETETFQPRRALIVEGILVFTDAALRDLMDIKVFVDTDSDTRFIRRLQRDVAQRGRTMESVIDQYQSTVKPMHLEFVEPSKRYADVIIPLGGHNTVAVDLLLTMLRSVAKPASP